MIFETSFLDILPTQWNSDIKNRKWTVCITISSQKCLAHSKLLVSWRMMIMMVRDEFVSLKCHKVKPNPKYNGFLKISLLGYEKS